MQCIKAESTNVSKTKHWVLSEVLIVFYYLLLQTLFTFYLNATLFKSHLKAIFLDSGGTNADIKIKTSADLKPLLRWVPAYLVQSLWLLLLCWPLSYKGESYSPQYCRQLCLVSTPPAIPSHPLHQPFDGLCSGCHRPPQGPLTVHPSKSLLTDPGHFQCIPPNPGHCRP